MVGVLQEWWERGDGANQPLGGLEVPGAEGAVVARVFRVEQLPPHQTRRQLVVWPICSHDLPDSFSCVARGEKEGNTYWWLPSRFLLV